MWIKWTSYPKLLVKQIFFFLTAWCQTAAGIQKVATLPPSAWWIFFQSFSLPLNYHLNYSLFQLQYVTSTPYLDFFQDFLVTHELGMFRTDYFCSTAPMLNTVSSDSPVSSPSPTSSSSLMCLSLMRPQWVFQTWNAPWIIHHENQHGNLRTAQNDESCLLWHKRFLKVLTRVFSHCCQCRVTSLLVIINIALIHLEFFLHLIYHPNFLLVNLDLVAARAVSRSPRATSENGCFELSVNLNVFCRLQTRWLHICNV